MNNSMRKLLTFMATILALLSHAVFADPADGSPDDESARPISVPLALDASALSTAFESAGELPYRCRTALKDFEKAIGDANLVAVAQRAKVTEIAKTYLKKSIETALAVGDSNKAITLQKALETADGEMVGDAEEIVMIRDRRFSQLEKIDKNLIVSGLTAAKAFNNVLEWQKKETTQKGDIEKGNKIAAFQGKIQFWAKEIQMKGQNTQQVTVQPTMRSHAQQPQSSLRSSSYVALPTMTCKLIKTVMEDRNTGWHSTVSGRPLRVKMKSMIYEITIRNASNTNETYQINWYVIGENNYQNRISIAESHEENINCATGRTTVKQFQTEFYVSSRASAKQENFANLSNMGSFKDIVVQLVRNGVVVRTYVSNKKYETNAHQLPFALPN